MKKFTAILLFCVFLFIGCTSDNIEMVTTKTKVPEVQTVVFQQGDIFIDTFEQTKLSRQEGNKILDELKKHVNIGNYKEGEFYEVTYSTNTDTEQTWTNFKYYPKGQYFYSIDKSTDDVITSEKIELQTTSQIFEVSGTIENSLWESMTAIGIPPNIIIDFADIFAQKIDFVTDYRQGDVYKIIYEIKTLEKKDSILSSKILAAQYITSTSLNTAIYFTNSKGDDGYFDENGKSVKSAFLKAPLQFKRISSYFTKKRFHPILKYYRAHEGINYAAPIGTPVSAVGDGIVIKSQYTGGYGNLVIIKHPNGYETYYGHLSKYGKGVKKGVRVKQGQVIGYVGATGLASGPNLNFRIKKNGTFVKEMPPKYILVDKDKEDFDTYKENILSKLESL